MKIWRVEWAELLDMIFETVLLALVFLFLIVTSPVWGVPWWVIRRLRK